MNSKIQIVLEQKAKYFEAEAEASNDKFNKGYFEGKAELARQIVQAMECTKNGDTDGASDALNGNT